MTDTNICLAASEISGKFHNNYVYTLLTFSNQSFLINEAESVMSFYT